MNAPLIVCDRNPAHRNRLRVAWSFEGNSVYRGPIPVKVLALPEGWSLERGRPICARCTRKPKFIGRHRA